MLTSRIGGTLVVRHGGREVRFDWSKKANSVQWAAFFSDCEHEVLEVVGGHRVTLTYNLHWKRSGPSLMATHLSALDQTSLHFYVALKKLVECPSFLPEGKSLLLPHKCNPRATVFTHFHRWPHWLLVHPRLSTYFPVGHSQARQHAQGPRYASISDAQELDGLREGPGSC